MIVSTAANSGSVISDDPMLISVVSTPATNSLSSDATRIAPSSTPRMPLITITIRYMTSSAPNVGHQRPLTSLNERPSAFTPRTSSASRAGIAQRPRDREPDAREDQQEERDDQAEGVEDREPDQRQHPARRERKRLAHRRLLAEVGARHRAEARGRRERREHEAEDRDQQLAGGGGAGADVVHRPRVEVERVVARRRRDQRADDLERHRDDEHAERRACRSSVERP